MTLVRLKLELSLETDSWCAYDRKRTTSDCAVIFSIAVILPEGIHGVAGLPVFHFFPHLSQ